jgi:hypothetical protein
MFGGVSGPLCRSLISKTVPVEDIGMFHMFHGSDSMLSLYFIASAKLYRFASFPVLLSQQMKTVYLLSVIWFEILYH